MSEAKIYILDQNFKSVAIVDSYESLLWAERYNACGDFEIYTKPDVTMLTYATKNNYIWKSDTDYMMIIEQLELLSDAEAGTKFIIRGRSLESILDRRIVWNQTRVIGGVQACIKRLLNDAILNPSIAARKIDNFIFLDSTDSEIVNTQIDREFTGDNLLEVITDICYTNSIGFRLLPNAQNQFVFQLYRGVDRTYSQNYTPYVIFSPKYSNLINSNYFESIVEYKNVGLVAGYGEAADRYTMTIGSTPGLLRRELYIDARDLQEKDQEGNTIPESEYRAKLLKRGLEKLTESKMLEYFDGEIEQERLFIYKKDFFIGDLVQVENEFGLSGKARIVEYISSYDSNGIKNYPTFEVIQED